MGGCFSGCLSATLAHREKSTRPFRPHLIALFISQNGGVEENIVICKPINIEARVAYAGASGNVDSGLYLLEHARHCANLIKHIPEYHRCAFHIFELLSFECIRNQRIWRNLFLSNELRKHLDTRLALKQWRLNALMSQEHVVHKDLKMHGVTARLILTREDTHARADCFALRVCVRWPWYRPFAPIRT